mmetsp:Transcript_18661/g.28208  ORF Transcript_18661/g.28208 Transcript_18661/m.28208 type:complete len:105 (+) Transcript_18661:181-495(+)
MRKAFSWLQRLSSEQKRVWMIGGTILIAGSSFKYAYFQFSRGLILDGMEKKHLNAKEHLAEARSFARWSQKDRDERLPPLTEEQKKQLQSYLNLMAEKEFNEKR